MKSFYTEHNSSTITRIACFGDSLTKGNVSYNWVAKLAVKYKAHNWEFKNFGVNGDLAFNALARIEKVLNYKAHIVFVLLGTNDINAHSNDAALKRYIKRNKLPKVPDKAFYIACMESIITKIKAHTTSQIVLITIPTIGEKLQSDANKRVADYNKALKQLANKHKLTVLDLHEQMLLCLNKAHQKSTCTINPKNQLYKIGEAAFKHYIFQQSWDTISRANGLLLTTDTIHFNQKSGEMLMSLIEDYLTTIAQKLF